MVFALKEREEKEKTKPPPPEEKNCFRGRFQKTTLKTNKNTKSGRFTMLYRFLSVWAAYFGRVNLDLRCSYIFGHLLLSFGQIFSDFILLKRAEKLCKLLKVSKESKVRKAIQRQFKTNKICKFKKFYVLSLVSAHASRGNLVLK